MTNMEIIKEYCKKENKSIQVSFSQFEVLTLMNKARSLERKKQTDTTEF